MTSGYKETGSWSHFIYVGVQDGITYHCLTRNINATATGLILVSTQLDAVAAHANAEVVVTIHLDNISIGRNYQISVGSGGFYTSATGAETVNIGMHKIDICIGGTGLVSWTPYFSINALF